MDEATKYLLGQGILGVFCLVELFAIAKLWRENKSLTERYEAKSEKHAEKNQETAANLIKALRVLAENNGGKKRRSTLPSTEDET